MMKYNALWTDNKINSLLGTRQNINGKRLVMASPAYQLLDTGNFQKLEQIGSVRLIRQSLQSIWGPRLPKGEWDKADAIFTRGKGGDGKWTIRNKKMPKEWKIQSGVITLAIRLTDFGHIGIFPEHHDWDHLKKQIDQCKSKGGEFKLLNLFAYTGTTSLAAAHLGAQVTHVDASKTSVAWGRENAEASGLSDLPIRWMVDDVQKFLAREIRRGSRYQGIILDPPSFGRGPKGNVWKIEEHLLGFLDDLTQIMADDFCFMQLSAHSPGTTPIALQNLLEDALGRNKEGRFYSHEMTVSQEDGRRLPSGAAAIYERWI